MQIISPVLILSPTSISHPTTTWLPAGSFSSHHPQVKVCSPLLPVQPALDTRGRQGSIHAPGAHSRLNSREGHRASLTGEGMNGSSKALRCPICVPLLPGILSREHKEEENGRGKGELRGRRKNRRGGRERREGAPQSWQLDFFPLPIFLPSPRLATFKSWF